MTARASDWAISVVAPARPVRLHLDCYGLIAVLGCRPGWVWTHGLLTQWSASILNLMDLVVLLLVEAGLQLEMSQGHRTIGGHLPQVVDVTLEICESADWAVGSFQFLDIIVL